MELIDVIDDILEQENTILPKKETKVNTDFVFDEMLFDRLANFIVNLNPDNLSDEQIEEVINIIEKLEVEIDGEIEEGRMLAKRTLATKNQLSKKWYRKNKTKVKNHKERLKRSSEGRKRLAMKKRLKNRTPTGRNKVQYHRRVRSDR
jgi:hypothetical protein